VIGVPSSATIAALPRGVPHVNAPLADLTLPAGRVLCDYLA